MEIIIGIKLAIICWIFCQQLMSVVAQHFPQFLYFVCDKCVTYWVSLLYCVIFLPIGLNTLFIPALASLITIIINKLN